MPRARAAGASAPKKSRAPKAHKLPDKFPEDMILKDVFKKNWRLGSVVGQGGFGLIYFVSNDVDKKCSPSTEYVMKIEPHANGPLFCELHFYQRAATSAMVGEWLQGRKMKYLSVPTFVTFGNHEYKGTNYRFLVMPRFGTDLQKLFEAAGKHFSEHSVYCIGLRLIDALEYLHKKEYVHADIKAANLLLGYKHGKIDKNQVYLVDYGLAYRYTVDGKHKEYKEDPRRAHDGTIEFTSRDAHNGVFPSRRGDLEILGYCLLQWLCGALPWEDKLNNKDYVQEMKNKYMSNIPSLMKKCFSQGNSPVELQKYLEIVSKLKYADAPDYNKMRNLFKSALTKLGHKDEWVLDLHLDRRPAALKATKAKRAPAKAKVTPAQTKVTPAKTKDTPVNGKPVLSSPVKKSPAVCLKGKVKSASLKKPRSPLNHKYATPRQIKDRVGHNSPSPKKAVTPKAKINSPLERKNKVVDTPMMAEVRRRVKRKNVASCEMAIQTSPSVRR
ncbi:hypothetical protein ScPMuIL_014452 [Solemya velum]